MGFPLHHLCAFGGIPLNMFSLLARRLVSYYHQSLAEVLSCWRAPYRLSAKLKTPLPRALHYEALEVRTLLSAGGLVDVGAQPDGALSGKVVYTHGGHGIDANNTGNGAWSYQRPLLLDMIEDLGNQDQMTIFADYLFRSGATVVPLRPVGHQPNEIILDNDDVEVTFSGAWSNSSSPIYFGDPGDIPYRFASTSATETATAEYTPNVTEAGFYPVYSWTRYGSDRAADQLYRINHSGGSTEVTVNHRMVGNGLVYLGTYHFEAGTSGSVEISNRSSEAGRVVIADMIRFGNGVGDIDRGGGVSGQNREDELSVYWFQWHVERAQGVSTSTYRVSPNNDDGSANVGAPPRYAAYMNREAEGSLIDRVFVSYHSNAFSGTSRGVIGLYNTGSGSNQPTPNQILLAETLAQEINDDMVDQNGAFEHDWSDRGTNVLLGSSFGEIDNNRTNGEFDATIVETGFHDNTLDAQMLRDPKVRDALARATYEGTVKYFTAIDRSTSTSTFMPGSPTDVYAQVNGEGSVTVSWTPPVASTYNGDAATGYMIYGSTNGYGFDGGTFVTGGTTNSFTLTGLDPSEGAYYFKVAAVNAGGESPASEVMAVQMNEGPKDVLIVNGFDRFDRFLNPEQPGDSNDVGLAERIRPRNSNSFDYAVQVASAIEANAPNLVVETTSNDAVISGDVALGDYSAVVWISGEESSADDTFNATEQTLVSSYLSAGGKLFVSGAEIGWDLDNLGNGQSFYNNQLKADYVSDDANTYDVQGVNGSIFDGLSFSFDNGTVFYDAQFPDRINPLGGATTALTYVGGSGGGAGIVYDGGATKVVNLGFPFEIITTEADRNAVMDRVLGFFDLQAPTADFNSDNQVGGIDFFAWQRGVGITSGASRADGDADSDGVVDGNDLATWREQYGTSAAVSAVLAPSIQEEGQSRIEIDSSLQESPLVNLELQPTTATNTPQETQLESDVSLASVAQRAVGLNGIFQVNEEIQGDFLEEDSLNDLLLAKVSKPSGQELTLERETTLEKGFQPSSSASSHLENFDQVFEEAWEGVFRME